MTSWQSSPVAQAPVIVFENEYELKERFAKAWLKCQNDPVKVACSLFPDDTAKAMFAARTWPNDPFVLAETERLIEEFGAEAFLPTREELAFAVFELGTNPRVEPKDRIAALKLYADIRGFVEKPSVHVGDNITSNKVMIVADTGSNEEWEEKLRKQQKKLTDASKVN